MSNPPTANQPHPTPALRAKLCDTRGFTLAEQLISIVFLGLLVVVIGVGLNAAFQSYRLANESTRANELLTRAVEEVSDELAFAQSVSGSGTGYSYVSPTTKTPVTLGNDPDGNGIVLISATSGSGSDGASGGMGGSSGGSVPSTSTPAPSLLVASSHGLTVEILKVEFNNDQADNGKRNTWDFEIGVKQQGSSAVIASTTMTVAWIG